VILVLAAGLRGWRLGTVPPGLCGDESIEALQGVALRTGEKIPELSVPHIPYPRWPVWCAVSAVSTWIGGATLVAVRAPAVIAGLLAVFLAFLAGRNILGAPAGLGAAAFLAFSFWHVNFSRLGIPFHLSVGETLFVAAILLRPAALGFWDGAAVAAVSVVATLGYAGSLVVPVLAVLFLAMRLAVKPAGVIEKQMAVGFAAVVVPGIALLLALRPESPGRILDVGLGAFSGLPAQVAECLRNYFIPVTARGGFWQNFPPGSSRFSLIESVFIVGGLAVLVVRTAIPRWQAYALGSWWAVSLLPEVLPGGGTHLIRALPQLAPVAIIAGAGAAWLAGKGRAGFAVVIALYIAAGAHTGVRLFDRYARDTQVMGWHNAIEAQIAARVIALSKEGPLYLAPPLVYPQALRFHLLEAIKAGSVECVSEELKQASLLEIFREPASRQPVLFMFISDRPLRGRRHVGLVNIFGLLREGRGAYAAGRYPEAEKQFRGVLAMAPDSAAARGHLGLALAARGRCREATPHLRYALKFSPDDRLFGEALKACSGRPLP
jgi:hypothetical protein